MVLALFGYEINLLTFTYRGQTRYEMRDSDLKFSNKLILDLNEEDNEEGGNGDVAPVRPGEEVLTSYRELLEKSGI